jgi:hypothetical protein
VIAVLLLQGLQKLGGSFVILAIEGGGNSFKHMDRGGSLATA